MIEWVCRSTAKGEYFMLTTKKTTSEQIIRQIVPHFSHIHPNVLTFLSLLPAILFLVALLTSHFILALFCILGSFFDLLDGAIARTYKKTSIFGEVFDSTMDRVTDFLYISSFGFAKLVPWSIVMLFLLASFLISYIRSRGELALGKKNSLAVGLMERPERLIGIFISLLVFIIFPKTVVLSFCFLLISMLSIVTILQRLLLVKKNN